MASSDIYDFDSSDPASSTRPPESIERAFSVIVGGALVLDGLGRRNVAGFAEVLAGAMLAYRAATGHAPISDKLGMSTAERGDVAALPVRKLVSVRKTFTIMRPADELYGIWRKLERLPEFMKHLERVTDFSDGRSHWVANGPLGKKFEWEAEITQDEPGRCLAWRSLGGSEIAHTGSVRFAEAPAGRGTEVHVALEYAPPAGAAGDLIAKLLGRSPEQEIQEDLRRFKQLAEAGEVATTVGQPSGRSDYENEEDFR